MTKYNQEFISIIESTLIKYIDKCKNKFQEITDGTETGE